MGHPFTRLVRHFLHKLLRGAGPREDAAYDPGAGALLGLLAAPGGFFCLLLFDKYSSLLRFLSGRRRVDSIVQSVPDAYFLIVLAMLTVGLVTVLKWDRILPDRQDRLNFAPLPVAGRTVFLANAAALAFAAMVLLVDVNAASLLLFPGVVTGADGSTMRSLVFMGAYALSVLLAGAFSFLAVFLTMGLAAWMAPRRWLRAISLWMRTTIVLALAAMLMSGYAPPSYIRALLAQPRGWAEWLPPLWYLGLFQTLQDRGGAAASWLAIAGLDRLALVALAACAVYLLGYARSYRDAAQVEPRPSGQRVFRWLTTAAGARATAVQRAGYGLMARALFRSDAHGLTAGAAFGIGLMVALREGSAAFARTSDPWRADPGLLAPTLMAAYLLIAGLRFAFELPAQAEANWIFQALVERGDPSAPGLARRLLYSALTLAVLAPSLAVYAWAFGWRFAALHTAYAALLSAWMIELLARNCRKIPGTCPMPSFRHSLVFRVCAFLAGFLVFSALGAGMEAWALRGGSARWLLPAALFGVVEGGRWWFLRESGRERAGIVFLDLPAPDVEVLSLRP